LPSNSFKEVDVLVDRLCRLQRFVQNIVSDLSPFPTTIMTGPPAAIIAPSVLAADFGQLTAECKRMMASGADWLHMGELQNPSLSPVFSGKKSAGNRADGRELV
jgi:Ribulose-phosphate 3 epimerase family